MDTRSVGRIVCKPGVISSARTIYNDRVPDPLFYGGIDRRHKSVPMRSKSFEQRGNYARLPESKRIFKRLLGFLVLSKILKISKIQELKYPSATEKNHKIKIPLKILKFSKNKLLSRLWMVSVNEDVSQTGRKKKESLWFDSGYRNHPHNGRLRIHCRPRSCGLV